MKRWTQLVRLRLRSLLASGRVEAELNEEFQYHFDRLVDDFVASGMSPKEAREAAHREMGASEQRKEECRDARGVTLIDGIRQDVAYAARTLRRSPGFTIVAVLSLALGIGANTAIFTLWNGLLRSSLPVVDDPDGLVILSNPDETGSWTGRADGVRSWLTYQEFEQLRDTATSFSQLMATQSSLRQWQVRIAGGEFEEAVGRVVSGGFFEVLGVGPALGHLFTANDDRVDSTQVVISHDYWQRRFGGRADVLGTAITIRKTVLLVGGVAPPGFIGETSGQRPDIWLPMRLQPQLMPINRLRDPHPDKSMWLHVFGRLKPGVSLAQAEAEANAIFQAGLLQFYGAAATGDRRKELLDQRLALQSAARGASSTRKEFATSLTALLAAVAVVLFIACANLANLLMARGAARQAEFALRLSLGASRRRLVRQLVTESLSLAALGGAAALGVAYFLHDGLVRMVAQAESGFHMRFSLDALVLAFLVGISTIAALLFGVLPAVHTTRTDAAASLKEQGRSTAGSKGQLRSSRTLVSAQLALSLPLLVGAGLLVQTVYHLQHTDLGFATDRLLLVRADLGEIARDPAHRDTLRRDLFEELRRMPGVIAVSFSQLGIFTGGDASEVVEVDGYVPQGNDDQSARFDVAGPDYFSTMGIPIRLGREFTASDFGGGSRDCVINDAFARRFFPGRNPIGRRVTARTDDGRTDYHVIGVAGDARTADIRGAVRPAMFITARPKSGSANSPTFMIRTAVPATALVAEARKAVARVDAALPIMSVTTFEEQMAPMTAQDRSTAQVALVFGAVALTLAAIGLYGILSYGIARRSHEIALRMALGARPGGVVTMIVRETIVLVGVGLAVGATLASAASSLIGSRLYGIDPDDPTTLIVSAVTLLVVALTATLLPARRASKVEPMTALRA